MGIIVFNGGRGARAVFGATLGKFGLPVTSVVNAYDDGKSTGDIRRLFGMLGPSDLRKTMAEMLPKNAVDSQMDRALFELRIPSSLSEASALKELDLFVKASTHDLFGVTASSPHKEDQIRHYLSSFLKGYYIFRDSSDAPFHFADCSLMNCVFAGAFFANDRNYSKAIVELEQLFSARGRVLLNSEDNRYLFGIRGDGKFLKKEAEIVELRSNFSMEEIFLSDDWVEDLDKKCFSKNEMLEFCRLNHHPSRINREVIQAVADAKLIIYAPGTQHSSLYPTYMTMGLSDLIAANKSAKKVFITNIGADYETPTFRISDYINGALKYLNQGSFNSHEFSDFFTHILVNEYDGNNPNYVEIDLDGSYLSHLAVYDSLEDPRKPGCHSSEVLYKWISEILKGD